MIRRTTTLLAALAMTVGLGLSGSARAAAPADIETQLWANAGYTMLAHVPGHPGNAHSGWISYQGGVDEPIEMYDWNCAPGATPSHNWNGIDIVEDGCTLIDAQGFYETFEINQTGPLSTTVATRDSTVSIYPGDGPTQPSAPLYVYFRQAGPLTRTTATGVYGLPVTRLTAPMRLTGRIGWISLKDPRVHTVIDDYYRDVALPDAS